MQAPRQIILVLKIYFLKYSELRFLFPQFLINFIHLHLSYHLKLISKSLLQLQEFLNLLFVIKFDFETNHLKFHTKALKFNFIRVLNLLLHFLILKSTHYLLSLNQSTHFSVYHLQQLLNEGIFLNNIRKKHQVTHLILLVISLFHFLYHLN